MPAEILCTIGPKSLNPFTLKRLEKLGVDVFRINLSHTKVNDLARVIKTIKKYSDTPICIDTEGAQVRTGILRGGEINVRENTILKISKKLISGDHSAINLTPLSIVETLKLGDFISIDFNAVLAMVTKIESDSVEIKILNSGKIGTNKAVTIEREIDLPALSEKDIACIKIAKDFGLKHFALSFAHKGEDVDYIRSLTGKDAFIISKLECHEALINLDDIIEKSDAILIDRGDLSREEPIERVPFIQKKIIKAANRLKTRAYVATNLLESMITSPVPTRAEVNDIYNTLMDGADGLVLAAETAIGDFPIKAVKMVKRVVHEFDQLSKEDNLLSKNISNLSLLNAPHGGVLHESIMSEGELENISNFKKLNVGIEELLDAEQIAVGTFSPLTGFMSKAELQSVLDTNTIDNKTVWTVPIVLQTTKDKLEDVKVSDKVLLTDSSGKNYSMIEVSEIFEPDLEEVASKWFGTTSVEHPGVKRLFEKGNLFVAGKVTLINKYSLANHEYELTPKHSRFVFDKKGWSRIVGFHTRNVVHRAHEYIQKTAIEKVHADGLYITPVVGPKKHGDFKSEPVLKSYQMLIDFGIFKEGEVVLGNFKSYPRYCGPRESVFLAICRKNMGCSHFIIGRDHAGVGNFYTTDQYQKIWKEVGDIGIEPIFFENVVYNTETDEYEEVTEVLGNREMISGTKIRSSILESTQMPDWLVRDVVQDMLLSNESKEDLFHS